MPKIFARACLTLAVFAFALVSAEAQDVVHALTGTVSSIDKAGKTVTMFLDTGSKGVFEDQTNPKMRLSFDKRVAAGTTPAVSFDKTGAYVIVFYIGNFDTRTAVAFKSLGTGPFTSTVGTVERFDARSIVVTDKTGAQQTFKIDAQTVAEGAMGVEEGAKFHADKGDSIRVVSSTVDGSATALFLRSM